jgi:quercetin dioxygenase-like cupin family protein
MSTIISPERQAGLAGKRASQFSGTVHAYVVMPSTDGVSITNVTFSPGARTFWHRHEVGQILQVLSGRGLLQSEGGTVRVIHAGDTVWIPAGERHWHGATPETAMTHTAISLGVTSWDGEVAEADYTAPASRQA